MKRTRGRCYGTPGGDSAEHKPRLDRLAQTCCYGWEAKVRSVCFPKQLLFTAHITSRTCWRTTAEQRKNERPPNEDFSQLERAQLLHPNFDPREQATAHRLITAHPLPEASCRDGFYPSWDNKRRASIDANGRMGLSQLKAAPRSRRQGA